MNCHEVKSLALTDYRDREMPPSKKAAIEKHLALCAGCRDFYAGISDALQPFTNVKPETPPASVWLRIQEGLDETGSAAAEPAKRNADFLRDFGRRILALMPRPVIGLALPALVMTVAVMFSSRLPHHQDAQNYLQLQMLYLAGEEYSEDIAEEGEDYLGSNLEVFLTSGKSL